MLGQPGRDTSGQRAAQGGGGGLKSGGVTSEEEGAAFITGFSLREGIRFGVVIKKKSHNVSFEKGRM